MLDISGRQSVTEGTGLHGGRGEPTRTFGGPGHRPGFCAADIVWIDDVPDLLSGPEAVDLLGGKGASLAEMSTQLDLPVPPAFVITTEACRSYLRGRWPEGLEARIDAALDELGERAGRSFGDPAKPLLVSVRSGAPVSMPGMMDTVLNVGINPAVRDGLARETGDPAFAAQTWLRFCRMYAEVVVGADFQTIVRDQGDPADAVEMNTVAAQLCELAGIPHDPHLQVHRAVKAVFDSWQSPRAALFRDTEDIDHGLGTAVVVQAMVFGNLDERSGTGVVFTRNPVTGVAEPFGDYLPVAQGEDVVAGTHHVHGLQALADADPAVHAELLEVCDRLEAHYRDMCDIEFTVASGKLHILQTRIGRRSPEAAVRIAVQMAEDPGFPLSEAEAVSRIDHATLDELATIATVIPDAVAVAEGLPASPGVGVGVLCCDPDRAADLAEEGHHVVLVRTATSPSDVHGMVNAAGLVTTLGGAVSHAAVVARSWGIPAVTGAKRVLLTDGGICIDDTFLPEGSVVTVDGTSGRLFVGDQRADRERELPELDTLRHWALEHGLDFGPTVDVPARGAASENRDVAAFDVLRTVQLKGLCSAELVAAVLDADVAVVSGILAEHDALVNEAPHGWRVTPDGRRWLDQQLTVERDATDRRRVAALYERFLPLDAEFKDLVIHWQCSEQDGAAVAAVNEHLGALHARFAPIVTASAGLVPRIVPYTKRFDRALEAVVAGDVSMLASPLKDSYHTVWFEYHEELIHLMGRTRLEEERRGA